MPQGQRLSAYGFRQAKKGLAQKAGWRRAVAPSGFSISMLAILPATCDYSKKVRPGSGLIMVGVATEGS